jgi:hypothetical protein
LSATVLSTVVVLGEVVTPVQATGVIIMLVALIAFQVWR